MIFLVNYVEVSIVFINFACCKFLRSSRLLMVYPLISEYSEAILSSEDNFDEFSCLRPVLDEYGNPVMSCGNFAVVYKMRDIRDGKYYAVKCFVRDQDGREETYKEIVNYISELHSIYLISVRYIERELFVDTCQTSDTEFPILLMDWVEGVGLEEYVIQNISNTDRLQSLFDNFLLFVRWLLPSHLAHGDLKPDNIIITSKGEIRLIDYDGMYVPSMFGRRSQECGTPQFQYSKRKSDKFDEYIDDYSAIYIALLLKLVVLENKTLDTYLSMDKESFVAYLSKYINDVQVSKLLSAFLMVNSLGYVEREMLSSVLFDELKRDRELELQLINDSLAGDTQAMELLGKTYSGGKFTPVNFDKALQWYYLSYLLGNVGSVCGICRHYFHIQNDYYHIKSIDRNIIHRLLCENSVNFALCKEGEEYIDKDKDYAMEFLKRAKSLNFAPAIGQLSRKSLYNGHWNIELLQKSASMQFCSASRILAYRYLSGDDVPKNKERSLKLFHSAAELGCADSQVRISKAYLYGISGYSKDVNQYIKWITKAAQQGNEEAIIELSRYYIFGNIESENPYKIFKLLMRKHDSNNPEIHKLLAICYSKGFGVAKSVREVYRYLKKAIYSPEGSSASEILIDNVLRRYVGGNDETNVMDNEIPTNGKLLGGIYSKDGKRLLRYIDDFTGHYSVKDGCEVLCDNSFNSMKDDSSFIRTLILPSSLKRIGNNVFCESINSIVCDSPSFVTENGFLLSEDKTILYRYFEDDKYVEIPEGVEYIKGGAFSNKTICEVLIPESVKYIGDNPFAGIGLSRKCSGNCEKFNIINMSKNFDVYDETLYDINRHRLIASWTTKDYLMINSGTKVIGKNAFWKSAVKELSFVNSHITEIDSTEFISCHNLKFIIVDCGSGEYYKRIFPSHVKEIIVEELPF